MFSRPGCLYTVNVTAGFEHAEDGSTEFQPQTFPVACKYVRRELRQLQDDDREAFLRALEVISANMHTHPYLRTLTCIRVCPHIHIHATMHTGRASVGSGDRTG